MTAISSILPNKNAHQAFKMIRLQRQASKELEFRQQSQSCLGWIQKGVAVPSLELAWQ